MGCTTSNFPPRPDVTNPDWWHVWKPVLEEPVGYLKLGATAVAPPCVIRYVQDFCNEPDTENGFGSEPQIKSMRKQDQGSLEHMMLAMVTLKQLGVEANYTCFRPDVMEACSSDWCTRVFCREIFGDLVELMEKAPYDNMVYNKVNVIRDGADATGKVGESRAMLQHDKFFIDWYRAQVNDCVAMWLDAADESIEDDLPSNDEYYGR